MKPHSLGKIVVAFFRNHLANQKGLSENTIATYSHCIKLFLNFCCQQLKQSIEHLSFENINDKMVLDFLDHLENQRQNIPRTRNAHLATIRAFFRFLTTQEPTMIDICQRICSIKQKKTPHKIVESLDDQELKGVCIQSVSGYAASISIFEYRRLRSFGFLISWYLYQSPLALMHRSFNTDSAPKRLHLAPVFPKRSLTR